MILEHGRKPSALKVVIYGPEGIGKSTFASQFPRPVFIDTEGSTTHMDVTRTPKPHSWTELLQQVQHFIQHPDMLGTLVIDTADWAEKLCTEQLCASRSVKGIEDFGYGKGYTYQKEEFGRLLDALERLKDRGVHIVLTAHAQMRKFEQPDEMGSYDRWELKLAKQIFPLVKEWADMILFCNYKTFIVNVDGQGQQKGKNKATGSRRMMYACHHHCWDAKNRFGLPEEMPFEYGQIAHLMQDVRTTGHEPESSSRGLPQSPGLPGDSSLPEGALGTPEPPPAAAIPNSEFSIPNSPGIPPALAALMAADNVKAAEIQAVASQRGYFPADMPVSDYPPEFVTGWCIAFWPQLLEAIRANREPTPF